MPIILEVVLEDGTGDTIPRRNLAAKQRNVSQLVVTTAIKEVVLDPRLETADTDLENNFFLVDRKSF